MGKKAPISFFIDNCVADSVGRVLADAGHDVTRLRDCMPTDTKDPVIAIACAENSKILVSHDQDFKLIAKELNISQKKYRNLHRISLRCAEPKAAFRIKETLPLIEWQWKQSRQGKKLMVMEIYDTFIVKLTPV